ncbi:hypothetical protein FS749_002050 [Ceratobasidium sp. UAMH 11750]|nr:hypothetical protein FS749_002050 [Ceratobasidium sp. UAMH 11750]
MEFRAGRATSTISPSLPPPRRVQPLVPSTIKLPRASRTRSSAEKNPSTRYMRSSSRAASTSAGPTHDSPPREETLRVKCERVLDFLKGVCLPFGDFVLAVCYGEPSLRNVSSAKDARANLYREDSLSRFLELCFEPPRPPSGGGTRPVGGSKITRRFVFTKARETFRSELDTFPGDYKLANNQLANMDYISTISSNALHQRVKLQCPELYALLSVLTVPRPPDAECEVEEEDEDEGVVGPHKPPVERHPHFVSRITPSERRI